MTSFGKVGDYLKEILAQDLQQLFDNTSLHGECTYKGEMYEVWEIPDDDFKNMCDMTDEDFERVCPNGMWRSSTGSNLGEPYTRINVNHHRIIAWESSIQKAKRNWYSLLEYFCDGIGASQPKNVCALATHLARANKIKMSELFQKYEG